MSIFYTSLYRYPRTDRLTVTFSILFGSMCGTAVGAKGTPPYAPSTHAVSCAVSPC